MNNNVDYYDIAGRLLTGTQPKSLTFEVSSVGSAIKDYASVQSREINAYVDVLIAVEVETLKYELTVPLGFHWTQNIEKQSGIELGHKALINQFSHLVDSSVQGHSNPFKSSISCKNKGLRVQIRFNSNSNNATAIKSWLAQLSDGLITTTDHQLKQGMLVLRNTEINQALREVVKTMIGGNNEFPDYENLRYKLTNVVASKVSSLA